MKLHYQKAEARKRAYHCTPAACMARRSQTILRHTWGVFEIATLEFDATQVNMYLTNAK